MSMMSNLTKCKASDNEISYSIGNTLKKISN